MKVCLSLFLFEFVCLLVIFPKLSQVLLLSITEEVQEGGIKGKAPKLSEYDFRISPLKLNGLAVSEIPMWLTSCSGCFAIESLFLLKAECLGLQTLKNGEQLFSSCSISISSVVSRDFSDRTLRECFWPSDFQSENPTSIWRSISSSPENPECLAFETEWKGVDLCHL